MGCLSGGHGFCFRLFALNGVILGVSILVMPLSAYAAEETDSSAPAKTKTIRFEPSINVSQEYTNNVDLAPDGQKDSALVTRITPSLRFRATTARLDAAVDGSPTFRYQSDGEDEGGNIDYSLSGLANAELARDHLFVESRAAVSQQLLSSSQSASASNQKTVQSYRLSPYVQSRLGSALNAELRYSLDQVFVASSNVSDQTTHAGSVSVASGKTFQRLDWVGQARIEQSQRSDDNNISRYDVESAAGYEIDQSVQLLAALGYQSFDDGDSTDFDSSIAQGGIRYRPGRRTLIEVTYGLRDDRYSPNLTLRQEIGARTKLFLNYNEELGTAQDRLSGMLSFINVDGETDAFVDSRFGTPFNPKPDPFDIGNDTSRIKTFSALLVGDWGRNTVVTSGSYARETKQGLDIDEDSLRLDLGWSRRATRKLTVRGSAGYERTEFDDGQVDDEILINAGLQYQLWRQAVFDLAYTFQTQSSDNPTSEYDSHGVMIGLRIQM